MAFIKKVAQERPEFKVIITSATLDPQPLLRYFNGFDIEILNVKGR